MHPEWWAARAKIGDPGRTTPGAARFIERVMGPVARACHRPTLEGVENLPEEGAFLLVANHSAGLGISEIMSFMVLYLERVGAHRPLAGFAHPISFSLYPTSALMRGVGAIPSTYAAAEGTLSAGIPILIFPGGDHETMRPFWQAHTVDFGGRRGFLRLARQADVPIVPMGIRGSHFTAPILWRSRALSYVFLTRLTIGSKRWAVSLLGVIGAIAILSAVPLALPWRLLIAWLWLGSPLTFLPWIPSTIRMRIGAPISPSELFGDRATDDDLVTVLSRVEAAVQAQVHD